MYLQRDNEITYTMPFYLQHSRNWATKRPSSFHFPLKRPPTIFLYFDPLLINSPCFAEFALCSGLFLWIRDKWTSTDWKTSSRILKYQAVVFGVRGRGWVSFLCLLFFIGFFAYSCWIKKENFSDNCDFDFKSNIPVKNCWWCTRIVHMKKSCLQLVFTFATVSTYF